MIRDSGFVHLGAPVGNEAFIEAKIKSRVEKVKVLLDKLHSLEDPHMEFVLLRSCFSLPKVSYALRTSPPTQHCLSHWEMFDCHICETLIRILGSNIGEDQWLQAQLPVSMGGLGLRSAALHASAAFLSSVQDS